MDDISLIAFSDFKSIYPEYLPNTSIAFGVKLNNLQNVKSFWLNDLLVIELNQSGEIIKFRSIHDRSFFQNIKNAQFEFSLCRWMSSLSPFSSHYCKKWSWTCLDFSPELWPKEVTFYGGSFNPWHKGHSSCLKTFYQTSPESFVCVYLDVNPLKVDSSAWWKDIFLWQQYLECQETLKDQFEEQYRKKLLVIYPGGKGEEAGIPTIKWMRHFVNYSSLHSLSKTQSLLLGADSFLSLDRWVEAEELYSLLTSIWVAQRLEPLESLSFQRDKIHHTIRGNHLKINFLAHHPFEDVSSTKLRKGQSLNN